MLAVAAAGVAAGAINAIVGSGSLITFPTLLAVGYPPVTANVSNGVGLVFGSVSGAGATAASCAARGARGRSPSVRVGALAGGILLLSLPERVFDAVVPVLILFAVALMAFSATPKPGAHARPLTARSPSRSSPASTAATSAPRRAIIMLVGPAARFTDDLQRLNAVKNVLAALANGVAAVLFIAVAARGLGGRR